MSTTIRTTNNDVDENYSFLQVSIAGGPPEKIVIQLYRSIVPKTCENFASLCGALGRTTPSKPVPTYRGSIFHRVVPQFMVQGGDHNQFSGTGGYAANGGTFPDENFHVAHDRAGVVSMANKGPNTNSSQFFITFQATPHLNKKHVAFGQVIHGMDVVQRMATDVELEGDRPAAMQKIVITDCGVGRGNNDDESDDEDGEASRREGHKRRKKKKKSDKKEKKKRRRKEDEADRKRHKKQHSSRRKRRKDSSDDSSADSDESTDGSSDNSSRKRRRKRSDDKHRSSSRKRSRSKSSSKKERRRSRESDRSASTSSSDSGDSKGRRKSHR